MRCQFCHSLTDAPMREDALFCDGCYSKHVSACEAPIVLRWDCPFLTVTMPHPDDSDFFPGQAPFAYHAPSARHAMLNLGHIYERDDAGRYNLVSRETLSARFPQCQECRGTGWRKSTPEWISVGCDYLRDARKLANKV